MEKQQLFQDNYSNPISENKKPDSRKRQHIKKDHRRKDKRRREQPKPHILQQQPAQPVQPLDQPHNTITSFQSETSKYQRLDEFWKVDIQNLYRKEFTPEDKQVLSKVINQKKPSLIQVFKNQQGTFAEDKISLQLLYKYLSLVEELGTNGSYTFVALQHHSKKECFVVVLNQDKSIEKAIQVSEEEMNMLAFRQQTINSIRQKSQLYNKTLGKQQSLSEVQIEVVFLVNYMNWAKTKLDEKLKLIQHRLDQQTVPSFPSKVQDNYITFLIKKNLKKALQNQDIDFYNHFKKLDFIELGTGHPSDLKPITDKRDFDDYIRKRKLKKTGKKARWVLKTACGGCLSYFHEMYNPLSFCTQCHVRYHKYCYIPKTQSICESCYLSKSNQSKRSRINECQLCGSRGFLYLPMDESNNAHIFCMLVNGLWKFENTQIQFQKKYIENAVENVHCVVCKQSNSCIYKCECCDNHVHPLCGFINGWELEMKESGKSGEQIVVVKCCKGVERQKNEKNRRFVLNYKRCVFSQCE